MTRLTPTVVNMSATTFAVIGTRAERGWPYIAAALFLTAYVFCDNADGGHARRTGQTSPYGEFLDHGLDLGKGFVA